MVDSLPTLIVYLIKRILLELTWGWVHLPLAFLVHTVSTVGITGLILWRFLARRAREKEEEADMPQNLDHLEC